ncbi:thioesterase family protein [Luteithermobacter gelatinilyticus]|uniref:thioesterase family protein n=1 Tax=Luteithermobacter gelatinilyticus TaxID=2582913 RepID=UPI00143DE0FF|nr:thioesterase family protein [Luteithermobacter gelatinilyticus]|tara:strand:- start:19855 stop:20379 length:525 start_codon:yes stop_codon:yes gene_type:complete
MSDQKVMPDETLYGPVMLEATVKEEWIDFNGHMNMAYYILLFDQALTNFLDEHDLGLDYVREEDKSMFALENHVTYQHELSQGTPVRVHFQLLDMDSKFIHYFMRIFHAHENLLSATMEQISLHVDVRTRRPARFPEAKIARLRKVLEQHSNLPRPRELGRTIGIRRPGKPVIA